MIVVDTSIWIDFLKANEPIFTRMQVLLENGQVIANEYVFAELMQGAKEKGNVILYLNIGIIYQNTPMMEFF